jgi:hypothetical protein
MGKPTAMLVKQAAKGWKSFQKEHVKPRVAFVLKNMTPYVEPMEKPTVIVVLLAAKG